MVKNIPRVRAEREVVSAPGTAASATSSESAASGSTTARTAASPWPASSAPPLASAPASVRSATASRFAAEPEGLANAKVQRKQVRAGPVIHWQQSFARRRYGIKRANRSAENVSG